MLNKEQTDFLLVKACNAALRAGACILDLYDNAEEMDVDIKTDNTPITLADRQSHSLIKQYLSPTHIPLMSEEGRNLLFEERCNWDLFWLVDPLDGTKEFIKGNGEFTVNIALLYNNDPVIGVIYVPYIRKIYFAVKGQGTCLKTEVKPDPAADLTLAQIMEHVLRLPLRSAPNDPLLIAISRSHNTPETYEHIENIRSRFPGARVIEQGSSYKLCMLAEGSVDVYVRTSPTYEWDIAAGEIILREAGGRIEALPAGSGGITYNKPLLHNPHFIGKSKFF